MTGMVVVVVMAAYFGGKCFSSLLRARVLTQNLVKKWWSRIEKGGHTHHYQPQNTRELHDFLPPLRVPFSRSAPIIFSLAKRVTMPNFVMWSKTMER